ncbi:MAG: class I SAM-dependent methyltransferase [Myxococcales bacterium]|nr:class I SAM-dependent methyltransferase [Myxococcales bacterium]
MSRTSVLPACPVCRSPSLASRFSVRGFAILRCGECGVGLSWPRPRQDEVSGIYTDASYFHGAGYYLDYVAHEDNHRRLARRVLAELESVLPPGGRILDVGAAAGFFLDEARARGFSVTGVELSPEMSRHARDELALDVQSAAFEPSRFGRARFSAVTFLDSLEHFVDPEAALAGARSLLEPGGAVALLTPNVASPLARLLGARWPHYTPPEHLWYFSPGSLARLLARVGFEQQHRGSLGHHWSLDELSTKLAPRARRAARALGLERRLARSVYLNVGDLFVIATKV